MDLALVTMVVKTMTATKIQPVKPDSNRRYSKRYM